MSTIEIQAKSAEYLVKHNERQNFLRAAHWCPDGSSFLTQADNREIGLHPFQPKTTSVEPYLATKTASALLCLEWYPMAQAQVPATYCYLQSTRDTPLALIDAFSGKRRAAYPIIDHTERYIGPTSIVFAQDQIFCGHADAIEIFRFDRSGEHGTRIKTSPTRKSREGQSGIICSLSNSSAYPTLLAAGSFARSVGIYDISSGAEAVQLFGDLSGSGISQVRFHPSRPELFVASRHSDTIRLFDLRQAASPLVEYQRPGNTNQRLFFDLSAKENLLVAGDHSGNLHFYDISSTLEEKPLAQHVFQSASSVIGSVSFHPTDQFLLHVYGCRSFEEKQTDSSTSESESEADSVTEPAEQRLAASGAAVLPFSLVSPVDG